VVTAKADSPAPTLILGKSSQLGQSEETPSPQPPTSTPTPTITAQPTSPASGFQVELPGGPTSIPQPTKELTVSYPAEGELVSTQRPQFFGTGPQNSVLTIILNSSSFFGQVVTDENGSWSWSPPENLEPGRHKLLVRYQDENGQVKVVEQQFTVLAAGEGGELPSFTSSPSATPTVSPTPTLPPRTTRPGTEPGIPRPGVLTPTFFVSIMGGVIFLSGVFLRKHLTLISD